MRPSPSRIFFLGSLAFSRLPPPAPPPSPGSPPLPDEVSFSISAYTFASAHATSWSSGWFSHWTSLPLGWMDGAAIAYEPTPRMSTCRSAFSCFGMGRSVQ